MRRPALALLPLLLLAPCVLAQDNTCLQYDPNCAPGKLLVTVPAGAAAATLAVERLITGSHGMGSQAPARGTSHHMYACETSCAAPTLLSPCRCLQCRRAGVL